MKTWIANALFGIAVLAPYAAVAGILEMQVESRQQIAVGSTIENVIVWSDHSVSFDMRRVRIENGQFVTQTGIGGARGRPPMWFTAPSTPDEIAVYRTVF